MDLAFTPEETAFREEVRAFIAENLSPELAEKVRSGHHLEKEDLRSWHRILADKGWIAPNWPVDHGGIDWSPAQKYIFDEECAKAGAPPLSPFGLTMVAPVIFTFGSDEQKAYHLPKIHAGEHFWCQGYSEPGSGSDLASLRTKAERDGDDYIVNGHKVWTTHAHFADWIFCLVRTDPDAKQQEGISFLLIDMKSPGITVRPIITIDEGHSINEVFLDNVRVPRSNLVGEENKGWTYAKFLLGHERTGIANVADSKVRIEKLKEIARAELTDGSPLIRDPAFSRKIADTEVDLTALEMTNLRTLADESEGKAPGPEASMLKIRGAELTQRIDELLVEAVGYYANPYELPEHGRNEPTVGPDYADGVLAHHLYMRATTIYGGSNEIQKNIIAKMVLGL
ncbi:MAG: acyl-CoA dehydrogenase family protein [Minwuiales bacterium]|nr:acyl-CoA dehydrogenase family protein [Minwuiales bacterium]